MSTYVTTRRPLAANVTYMGNLANYLTFPLVNPTQLSPLMSTVRAVQCLTKGFPPITGIRWFNLSVLVFTPALALYGLLHVPILTQTLVWTALYYIFSMFGKS